MTKSRLQKRFTRLPILCLHTKVLPETVCLFMSTVRPEYYTKRKDMGMKNYKSMDIGMLVANIDVAEILQVTESIKTLSYSKVYWGDVKNRPIEECNKLSNGS